MWELQVVSECKGTKEKRKKAFFCLRVNKKLSITAKRCYYSNEEGIMQML